MTTNIEDGQRNISRNRERGVKERDATTNALLGIGVYGDAGISNNAIRT